MKKIVFVMAILTALSGCSPDADVVSRNLSTAADNFQVERRIVFYNGITGEYMLVIEGLCSLGNMDKPREISITCQTGPGEYKKHFLGLSDNVTYFVEQTDPSVVSKYHYQVTFKPSVIISSITVR